MNNRTLIEKCAERYDSFYLYDEKGILEALSKLKRCFPDVSFLYSIKCNSNPHVLNCIFGQGLGADAASLGEVLLASEAGLTRNQIYYSAPGKTAKEIEGASTKATLIADSLDEVARIQQVAARTGGVFRVGLRINPDFTFDNSHGLPSKFGIDEEQAVRFLQKYNYENVEINGIHVHLKSQELNPDILAAYDDRFLVKPTKSAAATMPDADRELPYEGAEEMLLVSNVENREFLAELVTAVYGELPAP